MSNRQARRHPDRHSEEGIALLTVSGGHPAFEFTQSSLNLLNHDMAHAGHIQRYGGRLFQRGSSRLPQARCLLVDQFLALPPVRGKPIEWALLIDDDMEFAPDVADRMLKTAHDEDVHLVGGLAFVGGHGSGEMYPTMYAMDAIATKEKGSIVLARMERYPRGSRVGVDATGAAALLVHREVFEKMAAKYQGEMFPWFADGSENGISYGEDVVFCLRARMLGYKLIVDTTIPFGHVKTQVLNEELYRLHLQLHGGEDLKSVADVEGMDIDEVFDVTGPLEDLAGPDEAKRTLVVDEPGIVPIGVAQ